MNTKLFLDMLQNRQQMVEQLIADLNQLQVIAGELDAIMLSSNHNNDHLVKCIKFQAKVQKRMISTLTRLLIINLVYTSNDNFSMDTAHILNKLGKGKEALRHLFNQKFKKG